MYNCCLTNEKHMKFDSSPLMFIPWVTGKATNWMSWTLHSNSLVYVLFPSQEQHSPWLEHLPHAFGSSRSVSFVLQLSYPFFVVTCLLSLQMTHHHFPGCVINKGEIVVLLARFFKLSWYFVKHLHIQLGKSVLRFFFSPFKNDTLLYGN